MKSNSVLDFVLTANLNKMPSNVIAHAKVCVLDTLGAAIAAHKTKAVDIVRGLVREIGGAHQATLLGIGVKAPLAWAAFVNSTMTSVLDIDDGSWGPEGSRRHIGGQVIPAALAVAEQEHSTGKAFLEAVVIGYEVGLRTAWMKNLANERGSAGAIGPYSVATVAAKLMGLNKEETMNALGIAEVQAPEGKLGTIQAKGSMAKERMNWGTMTGVMATLLARKGFTGPFSIYDDPRYDKSPLDTLGRDYEMLNGYFKRYTACWLIHTAIDGVLQIVHEHTLTAEEVSEVRIEVSSYAASLDTYRPLTIEHAEYSFPFCIGAALLDGKVGPEQIAQTRLGDKAILRQADKVKLQASPNMSDLLWVKPASIVTIETRNGNKYDLRVEFPKGAPQNPLSHLELKEKFRSLAMTILDMKRTEEIVNCVDNMENLSNMNDLIRLLSYFE